MITEANEAGTSAISAAVLARGANTPIGMLNVAGPTARLSRDRMEGIAPTLLTTAGELIEICAASPLFRSGRAVIRDNGSLAAG